MPVSGTGWSLWTVPAGLSADSGILPPTARTDILAQWPRLKWDTWTRSEIMAVRGYPVGEASSAALAAPVAVSAMTTVDSLEVGNGPTDSKPSAVTIRVATNGTAELPNGPVALATPEALPEPVEETAGLATGDRSCSECGGPLPAQSRPERIVCSQRCRQRRHDRLRKSRARPPAEELPLAAVPAPEAEVAGPLPVPLGDHEVGVLEAIMHLSAMLPEGWHAEVGRENVTLSWCTG